MPEQTITPEQLKALQEKIKQMSPEELKDFQKKQCVFCQIIAGKIQAKKVYEDEKVLAILDINPANPGHTLVMTKEHYSIMPQLSDEEIAHAFMVTKSLSNAMLRSIDAQGANIIVANGIAAGQRAQHFMVHLIPRKENDGINFVLPQKTMEQSDIEMIGNKMISALTGAPAQEEPKPQLKIVIPKQMPERKSEQKKIKENTKEPKSGIDLDDISRLMGVK